MGKIKDLTGLKFNMLTVIELDKSRTKIEKQRFLNGEINSYNLFWKCKCECGNTKTINGNSLKGKKVISCGCIQKEITSKNAKENNIKHNEYEESDTYYKGWDTKHENFFLISKEDYEEVSKYCWSMDAYGYWNAPIKGSNKYIKLHQLIMKNINDSYNKSRKFVPDHLNRNKSDNRRFNLELKTQQYNNRNRSISSNNTSGKTGVNYSKRDKLWYARIYNNDNKRIQKSFKTFEEAVEQRLAWEKEFGYIGE